MIRKIYKDSFKLIGNPAKNLIKEARKMIAESDKEFGYQRVALGLAAAEKVSATRIKLTEIADWHRHCAVEKLETAVSYLRRAKRCALSVKFRKYAAMRLKKYERELQKFGDDQKSDGGKEATKSIAIRTFLKNISAKAEMFLSVF